MTKLQTFLNTPIPQLTKGRRAAKAGDLFGIELECEGRAVGFDGEKQGILKSWAPHADGSLRNNHGDACEWVFNGPVNYDKSVERVHELFDYFERRNSKLVPSNRTSTHIHYNMGDKSCYQLVNMFILFTILEGVLDRYCGEDRVGNLFCLSSRHAHEQIEWMNDVVFRHQNFANMRDDWRYCSFNFASINKFTTVEFRAMRGLDNREDLLDWLSIINEFCEYSCYKMKNPIDVIRSISEDGPMSLIGKVFNKKNTKLLTNALDEHEINASIYEGLRLVQMMAYRVGTEFDQVKLRGKDFWASFNSNPEPELDVDPDDIRMPGAPARRRGARIAPLGGAVQPEGFNPFLRDRPIRVADLADAFPGDPIPMDEPEVAQPDPNDPAVFAQRIAEIEAQVLAQQAARRRDAQAQNPAAEQPVAPRRPEWWQQGPNPFRDPNDF